MSFLDNTAPKCLLFDLGNVLVELDGFPWFQGDIDLQNQHKRWLDLQCIQDFESGKITADQFYSAAIDALVLEDTPEEFAQRYSQWVIGFYEGARELLIKLKKHFFIACLSNTNAVHIKRLQQQGNTLEVFDRCFLSHEIGYLKPDTRAFEIVIEQLPYQAGEILFVDDNKANVLSARNIGMRAEYILGFDMLTDYLNNNLNLTNLMTR